MTGKLRLFQTRTGSTGHLAKGWQQLTFDGIHVSNPNGLHRPFSQCLWEMVEWPMRVSNPNGLHRPFSQRLRVHIARKLKVSNPNGLHRPFSPLNFHVSTMSNNCFKPERAPQAI